MDKAYYILNESLGMDDYTTEKLYDLAGKNQKQVALN